MEPRIARRTGNVWSASAHIITGVGGFVILSLAPSIAKLGWVPGLLVLLLSPVVNYYTAALLAECYRSPTGTRSRRYKDAVNAWLGWLPSFACAWFQYSILFATAIECAIAAIQYAIAALSVLGMQTFSLFLLLLASQLVISQIPNLDKLWWVSAAATIVSFAYSTLISVLDIRSLAGKRDIGGSVTHAKSEYHAFTVFASLGNILFAYSFSVVVVEIQDTLKAPAENKTMKRATLLAMIATTGKYLAIASAQYAAFGNEYAAFRNEYAAANVKTVVWACILVHMAGAYQVVSQPIFECLEAWVSMKWPQAGFSRPRTFLKGRLSFTYFRLVWRSLFVIVTMFPALFFYSVTKTHAMVTLLRALGFWPLTIYFPVEMYIRQQQIKSWSGKWICLELLSLLGFFISIAAAMGSVKGFWDAFSDKSVDVGAIYYDNVFPF